MNSNEFQSYGFGTLLLSELIVQRLSPRTHRSGGQCRPQNYRDGNRAGGRRVGGKQVPRAPPIGVTWTTSSRWCCGAIYHLEGMPARHDLDQRCRPTVAKSGAWHQDGFPTSKLPESPPSFSAWLCSSLSCCPLGERSIGPADHMQPRACRQSVEGKSPALGGSKAGRPEVKSIGATSLAGEFDRFISVRG